MELDLKSSGKSRLNSNSIELELELELELKCSGIHVSTKLGHKKLAAFLNFGENTFLLLHCVLCGFVRIEGILIKLNESKDPISTGEFQPERLLTMQQWDFSKFPNVRPIEAWAFPYRLIF
jgi:hypothetical protein